MMAERSKLNTSKKVKNSLLSGAADNSFPFENFAVNTVLMPAARTENSEVPGGGAQEENFYHSAESNFASVPLNSTISPYTNNFPTPTVQNSNIGSTVPRVSPADFTAHKSYPFYESTPIFETSTTAPSINPIFQSPSSINPIFPKSSTDLPPFQSLISSNLTNFSPTSSASLPQTQNQVPSYPPSTSSSPSLQPSEYLQSTPSKQNDFPGMPSSFVNVENKNINSTFESVNLSDQGDTEEQKPQFFHVPEQQQQNVPSFFPISGSTPVFGQEVSSQPRSFAPSVPPQGVSAFRLGSQKRPVYAQPPGIVSFSSPTPSVLPPQIPPASISPSGFTPFPPVSISPSVLTPQIPPKSVSPSGLPPHPPSTSVPSYFPPTSISPSGLQPHLPSTGIPPSGLAPSLPPASVSTFGISSPPTCISPSGLTPYLPPVNVSPSIPLMTTSTDSATITPIQLPDFSSSHLPQTHSAPAVNEVSPSLLPNSFHNLTLDHKYRPMYYHWFHKKEVEGKIIWEPFSMSDSFALEDAFTSTDISPDTMVATDGGRYDVNVLRRERSPVYWEEAVTEVRRCSWFFKGASDARYIPYEENISARLEEEYKIATTTNGWPKQIELSNGETVVFHDPEMMEHFVSSSSADSWASSAQGQSKPRVVKRGFSGFNIEEGEPEKVDHLLFLVHGIGSVCDLKFRKVEEVVDEFRSLSLQLIQSHFRSSSEQGILNRIEILPISWHSTLHGEATGIDRKLQTITLRSIPKLRHFTNDTLLDILFYTSPIYCQTIVNTVGSELNRLYALFKSRNPEFNGGVSLGGHSLGSLILFDVLCHQKPPVVNGEKSEAEAVDSDAQVSSSTDEDVETVTKIVKPAPEERRLSHQVSYVKGNAGTGQPYITYTQLNFHPEAFFALGSPIAMFVTVRGIDTLGEDFHLPTCPKFFNIFHPFDPVAYRIETLINSELTSLRPVLIPHHKGRKRMHLELKETMARVGADLKQKVLDSVRSTWNSLYQLAMFHRSDSQVLEQEVDKVLEEQMQQETESVHSMEGEEHEDTRVGRLNGGRRIDYVLQEAPFESFNEYLFALGSHVCYWESEDTMLLILKEVYAPLGIYPDSQRSSQHNYDKSYSSSAIPFSRSDSVLSARPSSRGNMMYSEALQNFESPQPVVTFPTNFQNSPLTYDPRQADTRSGNYPQHPSLQANAQPTQVGMDPTAPIADNKSVGPPPMTGFYRK